jgi:hypothetical protein
LHSVEYELTSEFAGDVERTMTKWELRRGWRRDLPLFAVALVLAVGIVWAGMSEYFLPVVSGGLLCLLTFFAVGAAFRRVAMSRAASMTLLLAMQTSDRRVRIEFTDERVRLETEFFRGEGAWSELDQVVIFATFWVLYLTNGGHVLIPRQHINSDMEALIRAKAQHVLASVHQA